MSLTQYATFSSDGETVRLLPSAYLKAKATSDHTVRVLRSKKVRDHLEAAVVYPDGTQSDVFFLTDVLVDFVPGDSETAAWTRGDLPFICDQDPCCDGLCVGASDYTVALEDGSISARPDLERVVQTLRHAVLCDVGLRVGVELDHVDGAVKHMVVEMVSVHLRDLAGTSAPRTVKRAEAPAPSKVVSNRLLAALQQHGLTPDEAREKVDMDRA
ncbi:uncharacterized protein PFL1_05302 [Pseudozyma flocculosa PF-1]|uniref:Uncharacterized protein n=2 Tax=Pseudozyma flocculosa TaxID=84751 RepID=A0A5C3FC37_9BASI|nr:uncharacterized protein PFL1_05302 [Pseudozyma flocculosa PF-1]EPQ27018.1 hypothetical protein PFL1_05302 [Pseudozyma flocculosa PF-1]SPO42014.1 uncharacterized protein PSFLO_07497 [Pseudozyma flocculosa]